jgi:hypothetical protein
VVTFDSAAPGTFTDNEAITGLGDAVVVGAGQSAQSWYHSDTIG